MKKLLIFNFLLLCFDASSQITEVPITLSMPFDGDTIDENEPVFVWQSNLAALQTDPRLSQRLTVVKLLENQTPLEGLGLNAPVFLRDELTSSTLPYSSTDHELENNVWYAWQVSYLMNNMVIGQSEAWKFIKASPLPPLSAFQPVRDKQDGTVYKVENDRLNLSLMSNESVVGKISLILSNGRKVEGQLQQLVEKEFIPVEISNPTSAMRYFSLDLSALSLPKGTHTLLWITKKSRYSINFSTR